MNIKITIRNIKLYELGIGELSDFENRFYILLNSYLNDVNMYSYNFR